MNTAVCADLHTCRVSEVTCVRKTRIFATFTIVLTFQIHHCMKESGIFVYYANAKRTAKKNIFFMYACPTFFLYGMLISPCRVDYIHTYIHTYIIYTYIHTCIYIYIYIYTHTHIHISRNAYVILKAHHIYP